MYKQINDNLFEIHTPMRVDFQASVKSFVIKNDRSSLIIDTGFNLPESRKIFCETLTSLDIDLSHTRVVLTHLHPDHSGLASDLEKKGARIYFGLRESRYFERLNSPGYSKFVELKHKMYGLQWDSITPDDYPSRKYRTVNDFSYKTLNPGEILKEGDFRLEIIELPGHTPGHIGLYDAYKNLLFCGDHVLEKITPNVDYWDSEFKVIRSYRKSLKQIIELAPALTLTGHGNNIMDITPHTQIILDRQDMRMAEILHLIRNGQETIHGIASHMGWVRKFKGWDNFPKDHKWMACNQIMAFVSSMCEEGILHKEIRKGTLFFSPAK